MAAVEDHKERLRRPYRQAQRRVLPGTLPGQQGQPARHTGAAQAQTVISAQEPPGGINEPAATIAAISGWHAQTVGPQFTSYGPIIGEGDHVVEEWESHFHGSDGTIYNNFYCWIKRFSDGEGVEVREYVDSHHAFVILGLHAEWRKLDPPTRPRRRWRPMAPPPEPGDDPETVFEIRAEIELDPAMLSDPVPTGGAPGLADNGPTRADDRRARHRIRGDGDPGPPR